MLRHAAHRIQVPAHPSMRAFGYLVLFLAMGQGSFSVILPLALKSVLGSDVLVGHYYAVIGAVGLLTSIASTVIFRRFSRLTVMRWSFIVAIATLIGLTLARNIWHFAGMDVPRAIAVLLANISFALLVSDFLKDQLAEGQGAMFAWGNVGWMLGPLTGGLVAARFGHEGAFVASAAFFLAALLYFLYLHLVVEHPHLTHKRHKESLTELFGNVRDYFRRPELRRVFRMSFGINLWWGFRAIYIPLSIVSLGFGPAAVGWVGALTGIPLILLEFPVGKNARRYGIRKLMSAGYAFVAVCAGFYALAYGLPYLLFFLFAAANIGSALIEPLQNTYFFEVVKPADKDRFFGIYNIGVLLSPILAPLLGGLALSAGWGFEGVWLVAAAAMALFFFDALKIRRTA